MTHTDTFYSQLPTAQDIQNFIDSLARTREQVCAAINQRAENYYNCLDDYSYGGICDQAANRHLNEINSHTELLTAQMQHGAQVEEFNAPVLTDLNGNIVSDHIIKGKFGAAWIIKNADGSATFVSCAKNAKTYAKKGFKVMSRIYTAEYYYILKVYNGKLITNGRILSERIVDAIEMPQYDFQSKLHPVVYFALKNSTN